MSNASNPISVNRYTLNSYNPTEFEGLLLEANGKRLTYINSAFEENDYILRCQVVGARFFCDAENVTPKTEHDAKFCLWDLFKSESDDALELLGMFAAIGRVAE